MALIKVRNICNESGVGAFYHSESYSPHSHTLPFEPYLGHIQLKLNEQAMLDEEFIKKHFDYFKELRDARIIDFTMPVEDWVVKFKEGVVELQKVADQMQKSMEEGEKVLESGEKEAATEVITSIEETKDSLEDAVEKIKLLSIFGPPLEEKEEPIKCATFSPIVEEIVKEEKSLDSAFKKVGKKKK